MVRDKDDFCLGVPLDPHMGSFRTLNNVFSKHNELNTLPESIFNL